MPMNPLSIEVAAPTINATVVYASPNLISAVKNNKIAKANKK
jgi:hypothetical protein